MPILTSIIKLKTTDTQVFFGQPYGVAPTTEQVLLIGFYRPTKKMLLNPFHNLYPFARNIIEKQPAI